MKIIKYGTDRKLGAMYYRFTCPACKSKLEANETELVKVYGVGPDEEFFKFSCPVCMCNRYVDPDKLTGVQA